MRRLATTARDDKAAQVDDQHVQHVAVIARNVFASVAAALFILGIVWSGSGGHVKLVAYFFGALAYGCEIVELTSGFRKRPSAHHAYMPAVFSVLYIVLGLKCVF